MSDLTGFPPLGNFGIELGLIGVPVALEFRFMLRGKGYQGVVNVFDGGFRQDRIEHIVRVAVGMHVAGGVVG